VLVRACLRSKIAYAEIVVSKDARSGIEHLRLTLQFFANIFFLSSAPTAAQADGRARPHLALTYRNVIDMEQNGTDA
jgi:hypothetical protein